MSEEGVGFPRTGDTEGGKLWEAGKTTQILRQKQHVLLKPELPLQPQTCGFIVNLDNTIIGLPRPILGIEPSASCMLAKSFATKLNPRQLRVELLLGDRLSPAGHLYFCFVFAFETGFKLAGNQKVAWHVRSPASSS